MPLSDNICFVLRFLRSSEETMRPSIMAKIEITWATFNFSPRNTTERMATKPPKALAMVPTSEGLPTLNPSYNEMSGAIPIGVRINNQAIVVGVMPLSSCQAKGM
ncbi:MAG: hypothetical protein UX47_C0003G0069 [Candidatus Collierbacteria bacterium GW2011_GWA2_46_26]|uniref:Uncharacterized protein n=1 Tax=Candidatus Collierbacteria bacterium GW2011_GWA2_46_26 TaxID=1618381 RepID=A0A0G1PLC6_9BACT|nr:MAG: hypothetical protein UW29_C0002G0069 [Candidatus Collierbacteria bacterium GW2011_GWC2_44_13]KKU33546.1 MAG: hypothetical protein UX47_C0003G0069 [Candidatus Collierbacteria bacterium GW2011_GWA2_46_26]